jgi:hypothetical protein
MAGVRCFFHDRISCEKQPMPKHNRSLPCRTGLKCSKCGHIVCTNCCKKILEKDKIIAKKVPSLTMDPVHRALHLHVHNPMSTQKSIVRLGLCCWTPELYVDDDMFDPVIECNEAFEDKANEYRKEDDNPNDPTNKVKLPEIHTDDTRNNGVSISRSKKSMSRSQRIIRHKTYLKQSMDNDSFRLDGGLIVPSHHVIIRSRILVPFTHAMGQQEKAEKGLFHAVISPSMAASISETDFNAAPKGTEILKNYELHDIPVRHVDGTMTTVSAQFVEYKWDQSHQEPTKSSMPTKDMILQCSFIETCQCDILFELGAPKNVKGDLHLIAATFLSNHGLEKFEDMDFESLYKSILVRAGKQGFEASRSGGSQGMCYKQSISYLKHTQRPGSWPRHSSAVRKIIVNSPSRCGYYGIYLRTTTAKTACWFYNTPQIGGHQKLKPKQVEAFPLLASFPDCRFVTAQVLRYRNLCLPNEHIACAEAVTNMFHDVINIIKPEADSNVRKDFSRVGYCLALNASHTLVTHPVGFHRDVFSSGQAEIENKLLIVSFDRSKLGEKLARGRGGAGPGIFVYAILDWGNETKARRTRFLQLGGDATVRVTQQIMDDWLQGRNLNN